MKSKATTVAAYLESLPPERREVIAAVRRVILDNLERAGPGGGLEECMQYGVIAYCVPHRVWPHGHHTRPELQLMYMGLSSQKNDMVVYMLFLFDNEPEREWFDRAWKEAGKKSYLEISGAGCCLRFRKPEELAPDVIAEAMRRVPLSAFLENYTAMLARRGKGPDGKPLKKGGAGAGAAAGAAAKLGTTKSGAEKSGNKKAAKTKAGTAEAGTAKSATARVGTTKASGAKPKRTASKQPAAKKQPARPGSKRPR